ncbi:MAG: hypothetical protein KGI49_02325 [Patescibacteria group bacterium]|nr:hypothetical protein [Patescibacteria group bacterium]
MSSWSRRRKGMYAGALVVVALAVIGAAAFKLLYKAPSCFDGIRNGDETGVDCGGSCSRLCPNAFLAPSVAWSRFEQVAPGLYNLAAYIVNPNADVSAAAVPYHMALYDDKGVSITDVYGTADLPVHRDSLAFQGSVNIGKRTPARLLFEFTAPPDWVKSPDPLSNLQISNKQYSETGSSSSLIVTVADTGVEPVYNLQVYAVLSDADGNVLDFSKTVVDQVPAGGTALAPFTWPRSHDGKVISIEVLPVAQ